MYSSIRIYARFVNSFPQNHLYTSCTIGAVILPFKCPIYRLINCYIFP